VRFHERDLAAEPMDRLRHFDADRPAAKHEQPAGHGLHSVTSRFVADICHAHGCLLKSCHE
jgi:hypothetical protein